MDGTLSAGAGIVWAPHAIHLTPCQSLPYLGETSVLGEPIGSEPHQIGVGCNDPGRVLASMAQAACGYIVTAKVMMMATSQHPHHHRLSGGTCVRSYRRCEPHIASRPLWGRRGSRLIGRRSSATAHSPGPHLLFQPLTPPMRISGRKVNHGHSSRSDLRCRVMADIYSTVGEYVS